MNKKEVELILESIIEPVASPFDSPSQSDWNAVMVRFNTSFPPDFMHFIELMSCYAFPGDIYNVPQAEGANTNCNDTFVAVYESEIKLGSWPDYLLPFYGIGNGDYFALDMRERDQSAVYFVDHLSRSVTLYAECFSDWLKRLPAFLNGSDQQ